MDSSPPGRLRLPALQAFPVPEVDTRGDFIQPMLLGIGFIGLAAFAGAKSGGECLTGICVEGDVFPQSMSGAARRTAKDACGAHGENEFAVGIRVAG